MAWAKRGAGGMLLLQAATLVGVESGAEGEEGVLVAGRRGNHDEVCAVVVGDVDVDGRDREAIEGTADAEGWTCPCCCCCCCDLRLMRRRSFFFRDLEVEEEEAEAMLVDGEVPATKEADDGGDDDDDDDDGTIDAEVDEEEGGEEEQAEEKHVVDDEETGKGPECGGYRSSDLTSASPPVPKIRVNPVRFRAYAADEGARV